VKARSGPRNSTLYSYDSTLEDIADNLTGRVTKNDAPAQHRRRSHDDAQQST
jgi:hypothetical protein